MFNLLYGTCLAAVYVTLYWLLGGVLPEKYQTRSVPVMCMTGFLLYYTLFHLLALPMKLLKLPLSWLTLLWGTILVLLVLFVLLRRHRILLLSLKRAFRPLPKALLVCCMMLLALCVAFLLGFNTNTISDYDAAYYIGLPVSSTYSNTLELMSPYTGIYLDAPKHYYLLNTDTLHSAVIYQALNIHPLIERKWSFTIAMVLLFQMGVYHCGREFFQKDYPRTGIFCLLANVVLLGSYSISGVSHYFAYRTYEGKAVVAYLYTTMIFAFCLSLYKKSTRQWPWAGLLLCTISGISFTNTALFVVPGMVGFTLMPLVLAEGLLHRRWKHFPRMVLVLIPSLLWLILHQIL